ENRGDADKDGANEGQAGYTVEPRISAYMHGHLLPTDTGLLNTHLAVIERTEGSEASVEKLKYPECTGTGSGRKRHGVIWGQAGRERLESIHCRYCLPV